MLAYHGNGWKYKGMRMKPGMQYCNKIKQNIYFIAAFIVFYCSANNNISTTNYGRLIIKIHRNKITGRGVHASATTTCMNFK